MLPSRKRKHPSISNSVLSTNVTTTINHVSSSPPGVLSSSSVKDEAVVLDHESSSSSSCSSPQAENLCSICYENFTKENEATLAMCGHRFCFICIYRWLQESRTCPLCKTTPVGISDERSLVPIPALMRPFGLPPGHQHHRIPLREFTTVRNALFHQELPQVFMRTVLHQFSFSPARETGDLIYYLLDDIRLIGVEPTRNCNASSSSSMVATLPSQVVHELLSKHLSTLGLTEDVGLPLAFVVRLVGDMDQPQEVARHQATFEAALQPHLPFFIVLKLWRVLVMTVRHLENRHSSTSRLQLLYGLEESGRVLLPEDWYMETEAKSSRTSLRSLVLDHLVTLMRERNPLSIQLHRFMLQHVHTELYQPWPLLDCGEDIIFRVLTCYRDALLRRYRQQTRRDPTYNEWNFLYKNVPRTTSASNSPLSSSDSSSSLSSTGQQHALRIRPFLSAMWRTPMQFPTIQSTFSLIASTSGRHFPASSPSYVAMTPPTPPAVVENPVVVIDLTSPPLQPPLTASSFRRGVGTRVSPILIPSSSEDEAEESSLLF